MRPLLFLAAAALTVFAAADCAQSSPEQRGGAPRWLWMLLVVLVPVLGPIVWLLVSRSLASRGHDGTPDGTPRSSAPDDDIEFLRKLRRDDDH